MRLKDVDYSNASVDKRALVSLLIYIDDFDDHEVDKFLSKIRKYETMDNIFKDVLKCEKPKIYNSVYHISICDNNKTQRLFLHRLAAYLAEKGILVEFHNWSSEGVNICFPIEMDIESSGSATKEYKHRFTIHEKTTYETMFSWSKGRILQVLCRSNEINKEVYRWWTSI